MIKIEPFEIKEIGKVEEIKKGIVKISGLPNCIYGQWVDIEDKAKGVIIGFDSYQALALVLGEEAGIDMQDRVWAKEEISTAVNTRSPNSPALKDPTACFFINSAIIFRAAI